MDADKKMDMLAPISLAFHITLFCFFVREKVKRLKRGDKKPVLSLFTCILPWTFLGFLWFVDSYIIRCPVEDKAVGLCLVLPPLQIYIISPLCITSALIFA